MKISTHHKQNGDQVEWYNPISAFEQEYDIVYMSKVFTNEYTPDYKYYVFSKKVVKGGYGYNNYKKPFESYEKTFPDYSIYYEKYPKFKKTAFGYLTRGCPRNCSFCIVTKMEGNKTYQVADLNNFYDSKKHNEIRLLDPNIFACRDIKPLKLLLKSKAKIHFTGGNDIRLMSKEQANIINQINVKMLHFAWDNDDNGKTERIIREKRKWLKYSRSKVMFYVLVNYNTSWEFDLYRVKTLKELDCDPYIMIYDKPNANIKYKKLQRFVNNKFIFWSSDSFEDYNKKGS